MYCNKTYFGLKRPLKGSQALSLDLPLLLDFDDTFSLCLIVIFAIFAYNPVFVYVTTTWQINNKNGEVPEYKRAFFWKNANFLFQL